MNEDEKGASIYQFIGLTDTICMLAKNGDKLALKKIARAAITLTQCIDELLENNDPTAVECFKSVFSETPFLPVLKYPRGDDKTISQRFSMLEVGSKCDLNFSSAAKFDPHTPINSYVANCLKHIRDVREAVDAQMASDRQLTLERALGRCQKDDNGFGWLQANEIPIHLAGYRLPRLIKSAAATGNKSVAELWANVVIMPLIKLWEPDLEKFANRMGWTIRAGRTESEIQNKLAQAIETLAPPPR